MEETSKTEETIENLLAQESKRIKNYAVQPFFSPSRAELFFFSQVWAGAPSFRPFWGRSSPFFSIFC